MATARALMVMPRCRSRSMSSSICSRSSRFSTVPVFSSSRSANVLLPWSMWAMIEKLRICLQSGIKSSCDRHLLRSLLRARRAQSPPASPAAPIQPRDRRPSDGKINRRAPGQSRQGAPGQPPLWTRSKNRRPSSVSWPPNVMAPPMTTPAGSTVCIALTMRDRQVAGRFQHDFQRPADRPRSASSATRSAASVARPGRHAPRAAKLCRRPSGQRLGSSADDRQGAGVCLQMPALAAATRPSRFIIVDRRCVRVRLRIP